MPSRLWRFLVCLGLAAGLVAGAAVVAPRFVLHDRAEARIAGQGQKRKEGQGRRKDQQPAPKTAPATPAEPPGPPRPVAVPEPPKSPLDSLPPEKVEADVSTRSIAVTSGFTGTEIIVFGSVDNSRQPSAESGYYDVAVVVEGTPEPLVARKKSNVGGLWINTAAASFDSVPSYYAVTSTRPIEEVADASILEDNAIGLDNVRLRPSAATSGSLSAAELTDYESAVVRLKKEDELYLRDDYGVAFIGRSLFRSSIELPAHVPVGPLTASVYLFRDGALLSKFSTRVRLEREGVELLLYRFSVRQPFLYGLFAVVVAVGAGLLGSMSFRRLSQ
ncbi:MAG TPA: TIGR02186 family protein [Hyphomicrobiaceae bacterium]|nr:TIGR02186 family protein [Hyphomicrobiaceae bacterium]